MRGLRASVALCAALAGLVACGQRDPDWLTPERSGPHVLQLMPGSASCDAAPAPDSAEIAAFLGAVQTQPVAPPDHCKKVPSR
ncbi:hypothetical protein [Paracoccus sediminicola]|uniref:hypothetical protein n=1 Tax=Paracoccus sediminicola TaxID=3017783 RepID=UPI0022F0B700|nr:hypothetical protein [Paracoccus sediminicola]WBU57025.1 hypothetical protein PAF18_00840 [Paracoccus sediminicola]